MNHEERAAAETAPALRPDALSELLQELAQAPLPEEPWCRPLAPGETIGRFELVRELGRGGFGVVYEARDSALGRSVAFKAVRPGRPRPGGEQLLREADAIARLSHPNLVTLYDVGRCGQGPYLVLELLRGATLAQRLAYGPLGVAETLRIGIEVARALEYAHGQGVIHRDLKPSNVFLCEHGAVKVLDFGMAHAFGRERVTGGTLSYMAPEQLRGAPEDERTDVFALGVVLFAMLTGDLPFPERRKASETRRASETSRPAPAVDVPGAPALGQLVARMLDRDPVKRPRRAGEVLAALTALQQELDRSASTGLTARVRRRRRTFWRVAALLAAGALLGAGVAALVVRRQLAPASRGAPCVAVLPLTSLSSALEDRYFTEGVHEELITQLAKISGLRVIAHGSVQQYDQGPRDLRAIADALGASVVLEGTVQRDGDRVRVAVQLVDPASHQEVWAERFDRQREDVFAVQTEVALEVARALGAKLSPSERRLVERVPTRDREAHDLYLRAVRYWERSMDVAADNRKAEELLSLAVSRDPSFALAHAWLAVVKDGLDDCAGGRRHAEEALRLQPDLPQAHAAAADVKWTCDRDALAAIRDLEIAVRDAPGDAVSLAMLGGLRTLVGRFDEGIADLRTALTLDPRSYFVSVELARELSLVRRFDEAARACQRALEISPGDVYARVLYSLIPFWRDGDLGPAHRTVAELPAELPTGGIGAWSVLQLFALFPEAALERIAAGRVRDPFSSDPFAPRAFVAGVAHAGLGHDALARAHFAAALAPLEARLAADPEDVLVRLLLARTYAGLGRGDDAVREVRRVIADAREVQRKATGLRSGAEIAAVAGRSDDALEFLSAVLSRRDGLLTPASVRADPRFAPLRGDPRFMALVGEKAAGKASR